MRFCQVCGGFTLQIESGGCGGLHSYHRCTECGQVYQQTTGGIVGTPGGEAYKPVDEMHVKVFLPNLPTLPVWRNRLLEEAKKPWPGK